MKKYEEVFKEIRSKFRVTSKKKNEEIERNRGNIDGVREDGPICIFGRKSLSDLWKNTVIQGGLTVRSYAVDKIVETQLVRKLIWTLTPVDGLIRIVNTELWHYGQQSGTMVVLQMINRYWYIRMCCTVYEIARQCRNGSKPEWILIGSELERTPIESMQKKWNGVGQFKIGAWNKLLPHDIIITILATGHRVADLWWQNIELPRRWLIRNVSFKIHEKR